MPLIEFQQQGINLTSQLSLGGNKNKNKKKGRELGANYFNQGLPLQKYIFSHLDSFQRDVF